MPVSDPVLVPKGDGEAVDFGAGSRAELKIEGSQNGNEYGAVELTVKRGDEPPLHVHTREDETVYVLKGEIVAILATPGSRSQRAHSPLCPGTSRTRSKSSARVPRCL